MKEEHMKKTFKEAKTETQKCKRHFEHNLLLKLHFLDIPKYVWRNFFQLSIISMSKLLVGQNTNKNLAIKKGGNFFS